MIIRPNFIANIAEHGKFVSRVATLIDSSANLPDMVFKKSFLGYYFLSFDWVLDEDILPLVKELANTFKDDMLDLCAPSQEDKFRRNYDYYPEISFNIKNITGDAYAAAIAYDPDPVGMNLQFHSKKLVLSGSSQEWAIWGDRGFELAVIAVAKPMSAFASGKFGYIQFVDFKGAINLTSARFLSQEVPEEITERFRQNYFSKSLFQR